jgi:hypothetical protein
VEAQAFDPRVGVGRDAGFVARPSRLKTSKGTIQLRPEDVAGIPDEEFRDLDLLRAPLAADHHGPAITALDVPPRRQCVKTRERLEVLRCGVEEAGIDLS